MTARIPRAFAGLCATCLVALAAAPGAAATPRPAIGPAIRPAIVSAHAPVAGSTVGGDQLAVAGPVVHYLAGATPLPVVKAMSWVIADAATGKILAAHNAHLRLRPASTLKTLTSVTLIPVLGLASVYRAQVSDTHADGSRVGVLANATYTINDLLHGLLLPSGNDAASSLAHAYGGWHKTVDAMNARAKQLQALDTVAVNPSGLDADGQLTSAYDLALFGRAALALPTFRAVSGAKSYAFPGATNSKTGKRSTYRIYSQNRLLIHGYKGTIAGKTGFTTKAGRTYWGAATRHGHTLVVSLMKIGEPTESAAKALLTWGFHNQTHVKPVGQLVHPLVADLSVGDVGGAGSGSQPNASGGHQARVESSNPLALVLLAGSAVGVSVIFWRRRSRYPTTTNET